MKKITYSPFAQKSLIKFRKDNKRILEKINRYAETGAGDITQLVGSSEFRLRIGDYRVIFSENENEITIHDLGVRGDIYERDKR